MSGYAYKVNNDGVCCCVVATRDNQVPDGYTEIPSNVDGSLQVYWDGFEPTNAHPRVVKERDIRDALKTKRDLILIDFADPNTVNILQVIQIQLLMQQLNSKPLDAHNGYLRVSGINYIITGENALLFLNDLSAWGQSVSDLKNTLYDSLSELTDAELAAFDIDAQAWPPMPDITTYQ